MIDDHDRCEWVNVMIPAQPGCHGQNPEHHKMLVCVCVCGKDIFSISMFVYSNF